MEENVKRDLCIGILAGLILLIIQFVFGYFNTIPKIKAIDKNVKELKKNIDEIRSNFIIKDGQGIDVKVGINTKLRGNNVSVFKGNKINLRYSDPLVLSNGIDVLFKPSVNLIITEEVERNDDKSEADLFISVDAARRLGLGERFRKGLYKLKLKTLELDRTEKQSDNEKKSETDEDSENVANE